MDETPVSGVGKARGDVDMLANTPAVLLVGGLGTRLRSVLPATPKPLASVGKKSFLQLLIRQLRSQRISRLVMCTGYLADQIQNQIGDGREWDVAIEYSRESQPLGTGGAVKLARRHLGNAAEFLVMNGDSFLEVDLGQLIQIHRRRHCLVTMTAVQVSNASRYGTLQIDSDGRLIGFLEKTGSDQPGLINAGVYVFNHEILNYIPEGAASLEKDVFPRILDKCVYVQEQRGMFIDIGTPEDYVRAQELCDRLYAVAGSGKQSS